MLIKICAIDWSSGCGYATPLFNGTHFTDTRKDEEGIKENSKRDEGLSSPANGIDTHYYSQETDWD